MVVLVAGQLEKQERLKEACGQCAKVAMVLKKAKDNVNAHEVSLELTSCATNSCEEPAGESPSESKSSHEQGQSEGGCGGLLNELECCFTLATSTIQYYTC